MTLERGPRYRRRLWSSLLVCSFSLLSVWSCAVDDGDRVYGDVDGNVGEGDAGEGGEAGGRRSSGGGRAGSGGGGTGASSQGGMAGGGAPAGVTGGSATGGSGADGGTPSNGLGGAPPELDLPLGEACSSPNDCESRYCADGVCCESACADVCAECDAEPGTCTAASSDELCAEAACPDDTDCRSYEADGSADNCEDLGSCLSAPACSIVEAEKGTPCSSGAGECDGAGECVVEGKSGLGVACALGDECGSGYCAETLDSARVCCETACAGSCQACSSEGRCDETPADDTACGAVQCPADSACRDYPTSVTQNRCVAGACGKGEQVCPFTAKGEGTECATNTLCDASGGCTVAKRARGTACTGDVQCVEGHCVDGVCCESSCDGPCMNCRSGTGKCDLMPADDVGCPDVTCGLSPECVSGTVPVSLTTDLCKTLGACKTKSDCGGSFKAEGTLCDSTPPTIANPSKICDGQGVCRDPQVTCGSAECTIEGSVNCCFYRVTTTSSPQFGCSTSACGTPFDAQPAQTPVDCDEPTDCPTGQVCCLASASGGSDVSCRAPADCNVSLSMVTFYEVCQTPHFTRACGKGTCALTIEDRFPGWKFCQGF